MRLSCGFAPRTDVVDSVRDAEALGYHRAYFSDSPAFYGDVWIARALARELSDDGGRELRAMRDALQS